MLPGAGEKGKGGYHLMDTEFVAIDESALGVVWLVLRQLNTIWSHLGRGTQLKKCLCKICQ